LFGTAVKVIWCPDSEVVSGEAPDEGERGLVVPVGHRDVVGVRVLVARIGADGRLDQDLVGRLPSRWLSSTPVTVTVWGLVPVVGRR
jgi:hypothetical protein